MINVTLSLTGEEAEGGAAALVEMLPEGIDHKWLDEGPLRDMDVPTAIAIGAGAPTMAAILWRWWEAWRSTCKHATLELRQAGSLVLDENTTRERLVLVLQDEEEKSGGG